MTPYTVFTGSTLIVSPQYYGSIDYYAAIAAHEHSMVDYGSKYDKRLKSTHRTTIADVNGELSLTMPLKKPDGSHSGNLTWRDIEISSHGEWWNVHRVALESAYGRTPFFEFYIDRFLPVLQKGVTEAFPTLEAVDSFIDDNIRELLSLPKPIHQPTGTVTDIRRDKVPSYSPTPYYQVRASRLGFLEGLSILDLLFNLGPEASLWMRDHVHRHYKLGS